MARERCDGLFGWKSALPFLPVAAMRFGQLYVTFTQFACEAWAPAGSTRMERLTNDGKGSLMRKTLVTLLTAGLAALLASVGVAASPQTVTISASRPAVVYGNSVTLSGKISESKAGENVGVLAEPFGTPDFAALA